jgi:threonine dehydrogenase-like Zn-dependent dehydrogenase
VEAGTGRLLIAAPYFVVDMFEMKDPQELSTRDESGKCSAQILVAVEGCGVVESPGAEPVTLTKGDAVVIPASVESFTVRPQWTLEFSRSRVPGGLLPASSTNVIRRNVSAIFQERFRVVFSRTWLRTQISIL